MDPLNDIKEDWSQKGYTQTYLSGLSRNFCTSTKDEYSEDFIIFGNSFWLRFTTIWYKECPSPQ